MRDAIKVGDNITTIGASSATLCLSRDDSIVIGPALTVSVVEFAKFAEFPNNTAEKEAAKKREPKLPPARKKKARK